MARENPLVSIICSTFNRSTLLKRAIKSVLEQSMADFELIIVDDCSTDNTKEIVDSFGDKRIKYLITESNCGYDSKPKNLGIKRAKGEYICFLDDDDWYRPDALRILSTYMKESGADVVYGDYLIGDEKGKKRPGWSIDFQVNLLTKMNYISMCVVMVRREALLKIGGFDESIEKFKDWNAWLRLQKANYTFIHIPIIVAEVSNQEDSISNKFKVKYDDQGRYLPIIINEDGTERELFNPADCKIWPDNTCLGPRKPLKVAIYTMTWNRLEYTKMMAESIFKTADYDFYWFIIEQGSKDGTVEWIREFSKEHPNKISYIFHEKNIGLAEGWNEAIELIKEHNKNNKEQIDIIIKIDNDAQMLTQGWLKAMIELFERNSTLVLSPYVEGLEKSPGGVLRQRSNTDNPYILINDMVLGSVPNLGGICFAHHIDLVKDWKFDPGYQGNKDYMLSRYALGMGYSLFYMEEFRIWHIDGTTGQKKKFPEYFQDQTNTSVVK